MFELIYIVIALIGSLICGIWDLKTTNIPDKVCWIMIALGIIIHAVEGPSSLISSLTVGGIFLIFGLIMYYAGQWGGGDSELLVAIGFLLPSASVVTYFPFPMSFFFNFVMISALYSPIYVLYLMRKPGVKRKGLIFYRRISSKKLQIDDVIGEDLPKIGIFKRKIRGLTKEDITKIRKHKRYVTVLEGIPSGIVFPIALAFTLYFGDLLILLL
ncbi:MAG: A24 family peptidase [Nanoarchaeota archaeon]|nr:A24 family peptidase [Nanoarchaeota archaeon]